MTNQSISYGPNRLTIYLNGTLVGTWTIPYGDADHPAAVKDSPLCTTCKECRKEAERMPVRRLELVPPSSSPLIHPKGTVRL